MIKINIACTKLSSIALTISVLCAGIAILMVFGSSLGCWDAITGFRASNNYNNLLGYSALAAALLSLIYSVKYRKNKGILKSVFALVLGLGILAPSVISVFQQSVKAPPIHDITTNTEQPPVFEFLIDNRSDAKNTLVYGGENIAKQQRQAYPDIQPILSELSVEEAYLQALNVAYIMQWTVVHQNPSLLSFESTANTPFFNFTDDVIVNITAYKNGSRIDIRSVSRIGRGDRGVNAKRIIEFTKLFEKTRINLTLFKD